VRVVDSLSRGNTDVDAKVVAVRPKFCSSSSA